jgi:peptidoglycan/LPS O-acetylase OafA/YrhL
VSGYRKKFFPNLDALRFFSFFAVFVSHAFLPGDTGTGQGFWAGAGALAHLGRLGVDFFFVLSSFLITWIILEERSSTGFFKIGYYFIRRILRIWPLYFLLVFLALAGVAWQRWSGQPPSHLPPIGYLFTFTLNFYIAFQGPGFLFFLVFLWSIAIEEQFYVIWALFMKFLSRHLVLLCWILVAGSVLYRWWHYPDSNRLYFHTVSALGDFAVGALFAAASFRRSRIWQQIVGASPLAIAGIYLLLAASLAGYAGIFTGRWMVSVERLWFAALFACIIVEQNDGRGSLIKFGRWKVITYLGRISYGLYCYHGLVLTFVLHWTAGHPVTGPLGRILFPLVLFIFTTFAAAASYRYLESPLLRLKNRFY